MSQNRIPVLAPDEEPLTPCRPARARQMIDEGRATPFWNKGVFCIQLLEEPSSRETPHAACGIDPGSKAEGFTVKSTEGTYLNIQTGARSGISKKLRERKNYRSSRRKRKSPNREPNLHKNRNLGSKMPPSTKARWDWKIKICEWLLEIYPISTFVVEDLTEPKNIGYNPMRKGKEYFYNALKDLKDLIVVDSEDVAKWRNSISIDKSKSNKTRVSFFKHCIDSWVLAWFVTNCPFGSGPIFKEVMALEPIDLQRRVFPEKNSPSKCQTSYPFKRGALISHQKHGLSYIGDHPEHPSYGAIRSIEDGSLFSRYINPSECEFLCFTSWRFSSSF